ncbi:hypothetical protein ROZALSC1DRAFT_27132 [Rozella allomycis CSF55]|uniref:NUDIX hydrolase-like domain-containing protein n=1 Tax=Rozella allomycis (strain CSF55) TaxID=988480 RepID=A0A075AZM6_ROZAC|nr:NUDIX hydrolase-like domain-containing protein [Rozella allomycis CSF55]RKP21469.1 hypothetical protein ROZALSC1DRAFT_27132 [Rozella allomycis CSF55]|eukprot:EPZ35712.1 NUDIX hydrolase-like domain-containing protein [Rozella allomycis CSF55]
MQQQKYSFNFLADKLDNFPSEKYDKLIYPFYHNDILIGAVRDQTWRIIASNATKDLLTVFTFKENKITYVGLNLSEDLRALIHFCKEKQLFSVLDKWRNEEYIIYGQKCLSHNEDNNNYTKCLVNVGTVERSAVGLFGFKSYGVHLNAFFYSSDGECFMWIGQRSHTKDFYPNHYDQMVAGGLCVPLTPYQCLVKECKEEANLDVCSIGSDLKEVGTISYINSIEEGIYPETQYIFDLEIGDSFEPQNTDGEVSAFHCMPIRKFKPNCAAVIIDFCLRHGYLKAREIQNSESILKHIYCLNSPLDLINRLK